MHNYIKQLEWTNWYEFLTLNDSDVCVYRLHLNGKLNT